MSSSAQCHSSACGSVTAGCCSLPLKMLCGFSLSVSLRPLCEFLVASPAVQSLVWCISEGVCPMSPGVEHQHVRVRADPERAQARHRLPAVPGPPRGQWLLGQHHQVRATSCCLCVTGTFSPEFPSTLMLPHFPGVACHWSRWFMNGAYLSVGVNISQPRGRVGH